jgi:uncharacterized protein (TIGR03000 family)
VFVNGKQTTSTGTLRQFVSRDLQSGMNYGYQVRVTYERDGEPVTEEKTVELRAGESRSLEFGREAPELAAEPAGEDVKTVLQLHVPENAKVFLAGTATEQTGIERTYVTAQLKSGETWSDYTVRVELEVDGEKVVQERSLTIEAGKRHELAIDFAGEPAERLAQAL